MINNNHIIDSNYISNNKCIIITLNNNKIDKIIKLNENRIIYMNKEYDIIIIEIKPKDNGINNFMKLEDKKYLKKNYIYIIN